MTFQVLLNIIVDAVQVAIDHPAVVLSEARNLQSRMRTSTIVFGS